MQIQSVPTKTIAPSSETQTKTVNASTYRTIDLPLSFYQSNPQISRFGRIFVNTMFVMTIIFVVIPALLFCVAYFQSVHSHLADAGFGLIIFLPLLPILYLTMALDLICMPIFLMRYWSNVRLRVKCGVSFLASLLALSLLFLA
jgi:hypothetical protein